MFSPNRKPTPKELKLVDEIIVELRESGYFEELKERVKKQFNELYEITPVCLRSR